MAKKKKTHSIKRGTGLGLTICSELVKMLGPEPKIEVESEVSLGSWLTEGMADFVDYLLFAVNKNVLDK